MDFNNLYSILLSNSDHESSRTSGAVEGAFLSSSFEWGCHKMCSESSSERTEYKCTVIDSEKVLDVYEAAAKGKIQIIQSTPIPDVDSTNTYRETLLYLAAANGHSKIVRYLLERGAEPKLRNSKGQTALMAATMGDHVDVIKLLCGESYDAGINLDDYDGRTALHYASSKSSICILSFLDELELEPVDCEGNTPLHVIASNSHTTCENEHRLQTEFATSLLERGVDINRRSWKGRTPLMEASIRDNYDIVSIFLTPKYKANLDIRDNTGKTALIHAVEKERWTIIELFIKAKADINCHDLRGFTAVHAAVFFSEPKQIAENLEYLIYKDKERVDKRIIRTKKMIQLLTRSRDYNFQSRDFHGRSMADLHRLGTVIKTRMLNRDGDVNTSKEVFRSLTDDRGNTFLHQMCMDAKHSSFDFVDRYKRYRSTTHGVDFFLKKIINATNDRGRTALHCAAMYASTHGSYVGMSYMKWLLDSGAGRDIKDIYGKIPAEYAEHQSDYERLRIVSANVNQVAGSAIRKRRLEIPSISGYEIIRRLFKANNVRLLPTINWKNLLKILAVECYQPNYAYAIWQNGEYAFRKKESLTFCEEVTKFVRKLLNFVAEREPLFQSRLEMVGSAREETKINELDEFDFAAILETLGDICQVAVPTGGSKGYIRLTRRPRDKPVQYQRIESLDKFFSEDGFLLTDEVNSRFQISMKEVLESKAFWEKERSFDIQFSPYTDETFQTPPRVCATLKLRVNRKVGSQYVFKNISVDIVPCMHIDNWWPMEAIPCRNLEEIQIGCNFVFDQPQRRYLGVPYYPPYARISFASLESKIVADSPVVVRAAYMVAKQIVQKPKHSYILKTCLLYCLEAFPEKIESSSKVTKSELNFWVRKLLKCYLLFCLQDFVPCYFIPEFHLVFSDQKRSNRELLRILGVNGENGMQILRSIVQSRSSTLGNYGYCAKICNAVDEIMNAYRVYWSVCDDETEVNISLPNPEENEDTICQRSELVRKIQSNPHDNLGTSNNSAQSSNRTTAFAMNGDDLHLTIQKKSRRKMTCVIV